MPPPSSIQPPPPTSTGLLPPPSSLRSPPTTSLRSPPPSLSSLPPPSLAPPPLPTPLSSLPVRHTGTLHQRPCLQLAAAGPAKQRWGKGWPGSNPDDFLCPRTHPLGESSITNPTQMHACSWTLPINLCTLALPYLSPSRPPSTCLLSFLPQRLCATSSLNYSCSLATGFVTVHWSVGQAAPANKCTGTPASSAGNSVGMLHMAVEAPTTGQCQCEVAPEIQS